MIKIWTLNSYHFGSFINFFDTNIIGLKTIAILSFKGLIIIEIYL